jgi:4-amino-4-deoxy-L-arabinose transferase-like glycosyltransferase
VTATARHASRLLLVTLAAALTPYVVDLGGSTIWDANEAYYVETPREMLERGDYINPTFNYEPRFNKPVLSYWLVAGLYHLLGVSVATERVAIAAGAFVMIGAAFVLGRAASGATDAGWLAALGLAAGPRFFMFSRRILVDIAISAAMSLVLVFFALSELDPPRRRRWLYLMYVSVGVGLLIKGPVAAVLPALVLVAYLGVHGELGRIRTMKLVQGAVIVVLIAAPWYVVLYAQHGWTHITQFFIGENLNRYLSPIGTQSRGGWFYVPVLFTDSFPWSFWLPGALAAWWASRRLREADTRWRMRTLLLLWCGLIVAFFSFSRSKQDLYILPVAPAVAALGGWFVHDLLARNTTSGRRWFVGTASLLSIVLVSLGILVIAVFVAAGALYALDGALLVGSLAVVGGGLLALLTWRDARLAAVVCTLSTLIAINWLLVLRVLPGFEQYKPVAPLSAVINGQAGRDDVVAHFDVALPSMVFYVRRHIDVTFDRDAFLAMMRSGKRVFAVLPENRYEELRSELSADTCVIARHRNADVKLANVLRGSVPPRIVLAVTPCPSQ